MPLVRLEVGLVVPLVKRGREGVGLAVRLGVGLVVVLVVEVLVG